jgi:hypothetical protein
LLFVLAGRESAQSALARPVRLSEPLSEVTFLPKIRKFLSFQPLSSKPQKGRWEGTVKGQSDSSAFIPDQG